jgi:hypothetical protein
VVVVVVVVCKPILVLSFDFGQAEQKVIIVHVAAALRQVD